jgi:hypothetical protein
VAGLETKYSRHFMRPSAKQLLPIRNTGYALLKDLQQPESPVLYGHGRALLPPLVRCAGSILRFWVIVPQEILNSQKLFGEQLAMILKRPSLVVRATFSF